ncbi:polysaccharide biosynthesis protein [Putridiphycobacter roseus]|uniref:polysaccharide biosynthesis protein n=1 Tax=Putridiphycobacter roseus TaxID=2219161 RepID=UPI0018F1F115|nr:nucleoside-diphosphate sugar epimerase/dehydratase [Putridiphycobacter roseus]
MIKLPTQNTPRWFIFLFDIGIAFTSLLLAYAIRFESKNFQFTNEYDIFLSGLPFYLIIRAAGFYYFKTYQGVIRHTSTQDGKRVVFAIGAGTFTIIVISMIKNFVLHSNFLFPLSIIIMEFFISIFMLMVFRISVKLIYLEGLKKSKGDTPTLIFGAGIYGVITKHTLEKEARIDGKVVAFIDDNPKLIGKSLEGCKIHDSAKLPALIKELEIKKLIIAIKNIDGKHKREIIRICIDNDVEVLNVPDPKTWINGEFSTGQIKPINIEDLLGRAPIKLNKDNLFDEYSNKVILVTGAAGSIGSEIVRQLTEYVPQKIILFDQAESPLYNLENELKEKGKIHLTETVVGDIRNLDRLKRTFDYFKPEIIFHAAAYKHVPLMEENPSEAILTNIQGSKNLIDLAIEFNTEKFVLISTDKAVNPTNVMGCSKRIAEIYGQSANNLGKTKFITTRFGNVLGSNGSVIPLFKKQIEAGGPLTVTHRNITRYFMTIPEACQLVLEACNMGAGGEIFVFDMGESVKIYDLALKMIKLSGLQVGKDIEIKITGLRPGEKLFEELLATEENTMPTHHSQILKAEVRSYEFDKVSLKIQALINKFEEQDNVEIVKTMKELVPEFKSNNSIYAKLD